MKLNSTKSIKTANSVFRQYGDSWIAAREAGKRNKDGFLVIPSATLKEQDTSDQSDKRRRGRDEAA